MSKGKSPIRKRKKRDFSGDILSLLQKNSQRSFSWKEVAQHLGISASEERNELIKSMEQLHATSQINQVQKGNYQAPPNEYYYKGVLDVNASGNGYVMIEGMENDVFVPQSLLGRALHGDVVEVYIFPRRNQGKMEGEITRVIERKRSTFVGVVQLQKNFAFVLPTDRRMYTDIFVSKEDINGAKDGDKVLVRIKEWTKKSNSPYGVIEKVLGQSGEHSTEIHAILAEYGLPTEFPAQVEAYAQGLDTSIKEEEVKKRRDFRSVLTFTIDPADAKDFDDALSFAHLPNGNYEIGVHIADVSHYVQEGSILDEEAYARATSIYLVDRVVPMLPEVLSNFACSLRPKEEKYTFSAVFEINKAAQVVHSWIGRTVICSDERFAYSEAQAIIEAHPDYELGDKTSSFVIDEATSIRSEGSYSVSPAVVEATLALDRLAKKLRHQRLQAGAISFDKIEVKFVLDEHNNPLGVYTKESKEANKLIEEFMLLANRKVAEYVAKLKKTFVYRIHDQPDAEKLLLMQGVIGRFGYKLNLENKQSVASSINELLLAVKGKAEQNLVDTLAVRSMAKASYSTQNIGHYGLGFEHYSHFTSPIRRYPDVMAHRLLQHYLDSNASVGEEEYQAKCKHSSQMELLATSAERDSIKYMQVKYMEQHKDMPFVGVISGVTQWGIYVEIIENKCEGMVRARDLRDDYYTFDESQYALVGEVTGNMYQLGQEVIIKVKNADLEKKQLDFELLGRNTTSF